MLLWVIFVLMIIGFLALDLGVLNRKAHVITSKEAGIWTLIWVSFALGFSAIIFWVYHTGLVDNVTNLTPRDATLKYITGYLVELSLSIDNIFVIAMIFTSFNIPLQFQHRVLFWGILGAIVFRCLMILFGVMIINSLSWAVYIFGAFLIFTAIKMALSRNEKFNPRESTTFKWMKKLMPVTSVIHGQKLFIRRRHILAATPLFVALIIIEVTDIFFALDSIPAILAITTDPFLVFSSNILAILGLRSMYFFLANLIHRFALLKYSLVIILTYVGIKLILSHHVTFPEWLSLTIIAVALAGGMIASWTLGSRTMQRATGESTPPAAKLSD